MWPLLPKEGATLKLRNQVELQSLLHDLYNSASPNYRHCLTVEQFTERFGPATDDFERISAFARSNGLSVTHTTPNRLVLDVSGVVVGKLIRNSSLKKMNAPHLYDRKSYVAWRLRLEAGLIGRTVDWLFEHFFARLSSDSVPPMHAET